MGKSTVNGPFPILVLVYQRVCGLSTTYPIPGKSTTARPAPAKRRRHVFATNASSSQLGLTQQGVGESASPSVAGNTLGQTWKDDL